MKQSPKEKIDLSINMSLLDERANLVPRPYTSYILPSRSQREIKDLWGSLCYYLERRQGFPQVIVIGAGRGQEHIQNIDDGYRDVSPLLSPLPSILDNLPNL